VMYAHSGGHALHATQGAGLQQGCMRMRFLQGVPGSSREHQEYQGVPGLHVQELPPAPTLMSVSCLRSDTLVPSQPRLH
jgi:hypothetical protein